MRNADFCRQESAGEDRNSSFYLGPKQEISIARQFPLKLEMKGTGESFFVFQALHVP